ncbi:uncharacterized protein [Eurosta solidaginis]|uniref:uncharacterized protein isoform X2 n=1 Tax=Eurosta solidaginis TaxID=178769 RepID=UPI0035310283
MFTKMQKFCILAFSIASALLVFADANGYGDSDLELEATAMATDMPTEIVTPMVLAWAGMHADQRRLKGEKLQSFEEQNIMEALAATQTQTATTTARAPTDATMATRTVTLASSNAPATLTTTNDVDEPVLSTTKPAATAEVETDGLRKLQRLRQEEEKNPKQAEKNYANMREKQVLLFVEKGSAIEVAATKTTTMSSKISSATLATTDATPTNRATTGDAGIKTTQASNGNLENKSRADTLPLDEFPMRVVNTPELATAQPMEKGDEVKTKIIKNAKELRGNRWNVEIEVENLGEVTGQKEEGIEKVKEKEDNIERSHFMADNVFQSQLDAQRNGEIFVVPRPEDYAEALKINGVEKAASTTNIPETAPVADKKTLYTKPNAEIVEKLAVIKDATTTQATKSERAVKMNAPEKYEQGLHSSKLAKIGRDEHEKSSQNRGVDDSHEKKHELKQTKSAEFTTTTDDASTTPKIKAHKIVKSAAHSEEFTISTTEQQQQQSDKTAAPLASHANREQIQQKQQEKLIFEKQQKHEHEQNYEQQREEEQQSKPNQLPHEQDRANKKLMDRWQVQHEHNESLAIGLIENKSENNKSTHKGNKNSDNSNVQNTNNNRNKNIYNGNTSYKPYEQNNNVEHKTVTLTTTTKPTPALAAPLAHIYDLYPMRKEDFNTFIPASNEKLLKERTIYKPTEHSGIIERQLLDPTDMLSPNANNVGQEQRERMTKGDDDIDEEEVEEVAKHEQNLLANKVDKRDNIIIQRYDNINNLAATQRNINRRPITMPATTAATNLIVEGTIEGKEEEELTDVTQQQTVKAEAGEDLGIKRESKLEQGKKYRLEMKQRGEQTLNQNVEHRPQQRGKVATHQPGQAQDSTHGQAEAISDFTGKLLAEQDGVITEIEQKFRLNEFAATVALEAAATTETAAITTKKETTTTPTATPSTTATAKDNDDYEWQASNNKPVSYNVNHKTQQAYNKSPKNKYITSSNNNNKAHLLLPPQHDFIERRVKKSFDFPMHLTASASDTLQMPHVDFANTKFNTDIGAANTQTFSGAASGATGETSSTVNGAAMRAALGTHPEFSTTKFYNSKELYNEMMQHNRQRLKAMAKMEELKETQTRTTTLHAPNFTQAPRTTTSGISMSANSMVTGVHAVSSKSALPQSSKSETSKYVPGAAAAAAVPDKAIIGSTVHMHSQQRVSNESAPKSSIVDMAAANRDREKAAQAEEEKSAEVHQKQWHGISVDHKVYESLTHKPTTPAQPTNIALPASYEADKEKAIKKYQQNFKRAKLLIKSLLLPTSVRKLNSSAESVISAPTNTAANYKYAKHNNNEAPSNRVVSMPTQKPTAMAKANMPNEDYNIDDLSQTAKTFDIMSLKQNSDIFTPSIVAKSAAAIGNIDDNNSTDSQHTAMKKAQMWDTNTKWVNFDDSSAIIAVKRTKPSVATTTLTTPVKTTTSTLANNAKSMSITSRRSFPLTSTTSQDDPTTTPLPLIYPYPQLLHHTNLPRLLSQPHYTTAAAVSSTTRTTTTIAPSTIDFAFHPSGTSTITTTTTNHSKSPSKPIVRPRILSPLQEKINSLECEIQNVPSDSHLRRGNETHELLLPIMTSENCPYGGTDCSPLLASWEGEAEIQSGDILVVEINDNLLTLRQHNMTSTSPTHNIQVYQVTRSGHEHCDVTEGILLDIAPLVVDGRNLVTLCDKDLTEGVNLLIVVSELWGSQCIRLKVTTKTDNCGENAECSGKGICFSNNVMEEYECQCCSGFAGPHCEEIDACTPSPCTNNGICVDLSQGHEGNSYQCLCPYGYAGKNCQYESDPCNSAECMNGGSCVGNSTHFRCDCTAGYTGPLCQHSLNECESSPCVHGICVDQEDGFRCFCQPGFAGELCNFEYNECESNPCQNDGECIDHIGNFECRCTKGYTGTRCQIKVDFCANKPCPDGHHCIDHGNEFSCECPGGNNGLDCNQMPRKMSLWLRPSLVPVNLWSTIQAPEILMTKLSVHRSSLRVPLNCIMHTLVLVYWQQPFLSLPLWSPSVIAR